jgi:hypothetical protein
MFDGHLVGYVTFFQKQSSFLSRADQHYFI